MVDVAVQGLVHFEHEFGDATSFPHAAHSRGSDCELPGHDTPGTHHSGFNWLTDGITAIEHLQERKKPDTMDRRWRDADRGKEHQPLVGSRTATKGDRCGNEHREGNEDTAVLPEDSGNQNRERTTMCGIVGAVAERNIVPVLLEPLRRLEYRGYDSAGIAVVQSDNTLGTTM